ncbi:CidA/LrgA family protein [Hutsoniella sourekii]|uniref:CidA/LrgA family protein n=1 Tax=Hutsoniella sourekii TaxID=87650 RepID=UPI00047F1D45|nr:CidA/LrgA family protein [Hutsoniella sourekii]
MKIYKQLFWLFFFSFLGEVLSILIRPILTLPGSVIGMILLFLCLHYQILPMEEVDESGSWLTGNMAILFVPGGVALMNQFHVLKDIWWQLILLVVLTTLITMVVTGKTVQFSIAKEIKKGRKS